jgi:glycolate oxidase FAD binding subunit
MTAHMPSDLANAGADVRQAGDDDVVGDCRAKYVAAPASTDEAAAVMKAAAALDLTVVARGSGSRLAWGRPPRSCDLIVDTGLLDQIVEHAAGDLVVTVQAGVRLDTLSARLAEQGQRLALDPPGAGTVGGLIATGVAGPLRLRYGAPRDLLIGITVIRADGAVARSGGKVVKNVAGYDLGKLFSGSYGTLGLITEATFRLHPRPAATAYLEVTCPDVAAAVAMVRAAVDSPVAPAAIELHWPAAADALTVVVQLEGDEAGLAERLDRLTGLLPAEAASTSTWPLWWGWQGDASQTVLRVAFWPGQLSEVLTAIRSAATVTGLDPQIAGAAAAGVLHVAVSAAFPPKIVGQFVTGLRAALTGLGTGVLPPVRASAVVLHALPGVVAAVDMWGPAPGADLMLAIKDQFDPERRLAPGRFAGGI